MYSYPDIIMQTLAADLACNIHDLTSDGISFVEAQELPGRRRFPWLAHPLLIVGFRNSLVISSTAERLPWLQHQLSNISITELFSAHATALLADFIQAEGQSLAGPELRYLCQQKPTVSLPADDRMQFTILSEREAILALYQDRRFPNALTYDPHGPRADIMACLAHRDHELIGMAAASADTDHLWQIGVDVLPPWRQGGVGRSLVATLTAAIIAAEKVPYYSTVSGNIASQRLGISTGYRPAWIELYAR